MSTKSNLRFLLALGGQRIVVLKEQHQTNLYINPLQHQKNISPAHLYAALQAK